MAAEHPNQLIVFSRWPEPGRTKTRMVPTLGPVGAADLQRRMTRHTLGWASDLARRGDVHVEVRYAGGDHERMAGGFGADFDYAPQGDGDLGQRMERAARAAFEAGAQRVMLLGTDCPTVDSAALGKAFESLAHNDLVVGPATDGGYYLIGMRAPQAHLFEGPAWGSETVLASTLAIAQRLGLTVALLEPRDDVDRPEDLAVWESARLQNAPPWASPAISVVIPALNEEAALPATLEAATAARGVEIIVVDGGSNDATGSIARAAGVHVIQSKRGRATQMNAGAQAAQSQHLLFCHADTLLPTGYDDLVRDTLADPNVAIGAFDLKINSDRPGLRRVERAVARRSRSGRMPYGDQALFLQHAVFQSLGGYRDLPIMEDYDLVRRARRRGRIAIATGHVLTSGRYWEACGVWRTTLINSLVVVGFRLGIPPARLAAWRRRRFARAASA